MEKQSFNVFNILILLGCIQGILLSVLLLNNSRFRKKSNSFLAVMIASFSLSNLRQVGIDVGWANTYPIIWFLPLTFGLLIPVVFYLFLKYLINPDYRPGTKIYWMLIPFFVSFSFQVMLLIMFLSDSLRGHFKILGIFSVGLEIASIVYSLIILWIVFTELSNYEQKLKDNFSTLKNKSLKWLQNLIIGLFVLWILWSVPYLYEVYAGHFLQWHHYPLWIGMSVVVYWIGYAAHSRAEIFEVPVFAEPLSRQIKLSEKTDDHYERLIHCMNTQKPFLNADLSLEGLANEVELSAGYLSQIINKKEGIRFYDFINKYRVEEAKKLLITPQFDHYSVLAIGLESGFNSKSTFNAAFKKHAGTTPTAFKGEHKSVKIINSPE